MRALNWQVKFWAVVDEARQQTFAWGSHDCVTFAVKCVAAVTGDEGIAQRIAEKFGSWHDARDAIQAHGGELGKSVDEFLGQRVRWTRLSMGDIALVIDDDGKELVAVHDGAQLIAPDNTGLRSIPFRCAQGGWKV